MISVVVTVQTSSPIPNGSIDNYSLLAKLFFYSRKALLRGISYFENLGMPSKVML
jgi:hypothetical protein